MREIGRRTLLVSGLAGVIAGEACGTTSRGPASVTTCASGASVRYDTETYHIKHFGAVCDGSTDDAVAVQAAIDAVPDFAGGRVIIPANTAISSSIVIASKPGIIIQGEVGQAFYFVGSPRVPSLKWIGAPGGKMFSINNAVMLSMRDLSISGENAADYGLYFVGSTTGWGICNYENLAIYGCVKSAVYKTKAVGAPAGNDFGRNHWKRCSFVKSAAATGTAKNDAVFVYDNDSGVQDVFDHCEWLCISAGVSVAGSYALWIEAGTPRIYIRDSYTKAANGIFSNSSGATPKFILTRHYSEDINFVSLPNANTRQVLDECVHSAIGGTSIVWHGASGGGAPLVINGGQFNGTAASSFSNANALVILNNAPQFSLPPNFIAPQMVIRLGRSSGSAVAATEAHSAFNGLAFVPALYVNGSANVYVDLVLGSAVSQTLTANARICAPTNLDPNGLDVGREIVIIIKGGPTVAYTATFDAAYKLAGGGYAHSGIGKTDVLSFIYDGDAWREKCRAMNMPN